MLIVNAVVFDGREFQKGLHLHKKEQLVNRLINCYLHTFFAHVKGVISIIY